MVNGGLQGQHSPCKLGFSKGQQPFLVDGLSAVLEIWLHGTLTVQLLQVVIIAGGSVLN